MLNDRHAFQQQGRRSFLRWQSLCVFLLIIVSADAFAFRYKWTPESIPQGATLVQDNRDNALRIENQSGTSLTLRLATIANPPVSGTSYQLSGSVRYDQVKGKAYLEIWNYFQDPVTGETEKYFSRTVNASGSMAAISGTSDWRYFSLPFYLSEERDRPAKIEFNLVMPENGTVYVRGFELKQGTSSPRIAGRWWSVGGALFGIICALLGTLAGLAKARTFVMVTSSVLLVISVFLLGYGLFGLARGLPYLDWYGPSLIGLLGLILFPMLIPRYRKSYEQSELRRLAAKDMMTDG